ncbi:hypothetical protein JN757_22010 [Pseudomonas granadensis]|uniref:Ig-like domain (Group 3) n=1 Tax=Pseudomonas granadensis TaxID=1421430 RepID=A0ABX7GFD4_9PSED|nr:hypothetical protein [Pseudomonas granadensis]QRK83189.1 hypothetical protein JN757_22010 [Pseudomonas granadensis]
MSNNDVPGSDDANGSVLPDDPQAPLNPAATDIDDPVLAVPQLVFDGSGPALLVDKDMQLRFFIPKSDNLRHKVQLRFHGSVDSEFRNLVENVEYLSNTWHTLDVYGLPENTRQVFFDGTWHYFNKWAPWKQRTAVIRKAAEFHAANVVTTTVSGTARQGSIIKLVRPTDSAVMSTVATADSNGQWTVTLSTGLPPGVHNLRIREDVAGTQGRVTQTKTFTVLGKPSITLPVSVINVQRPVISGTGQPGAEVNVFISNSGTEVVNRTPVGANGQWSATSEHNFALGAYHSVVARQIMQGVDSGWGASKSFYLIGPPVITTPRASQTVEMSITFSGTAAAGLYQNRVDVYSETLGTGQSVAVGWPQGDRGEWSRGGTLPPGPHSITATHEFLKVTSIRSEPFPLYVRPGMPTITANITGETVTLSGTGYNGANVLMHVHRSGDGGTAYFAPAITAGSWSHVIPPTWLPGNYSFTGQQSVSDGGSCRIRSSGWATAVSVRVPTPPPASVSATVNGQRATFSGRGKQWEPNIVKIAIFNNGVALANVPQATVSTDLSWSTSATADLPPGNYTQLTARQWVNTVWSADSAKFAMTVPSPVPVFIYPPLHSTSGQRPQISGTAWPGSAIVLKIPGKPDVPLTATGGSFVLNASDDWAPGTYTLTARATFGEQLSPQASRTFTVKTPKPVITTPANAEVDLIPLIQGTGYTGCWVVVYLESNNSEIGAKLVDQSGKWEFPLLEQVPGPLKIYALQKEARESTNVSDQSPTLTVTVRVPKPVITEPAANGRPARTAWFRGTAGYPGFVALTLKGANQPFLKDIEVKQDGTWEARVTLEVGGPVTIEARLEQKNYPSEPTERVITVVPAVPVVDTPCEGQPLGRELTISGYGYPDDAVHVQRTGRPHNFPDLIVKKDGTWSGSFLHDMRGTDGIKAFARAGAGLDSVSSPVLKFSLLGAAPQIIEPLFDDRVGVRPLFSGIATPGATITVAAWFNTDEVLAPPVEADADGRWAVTGNKDLPVGATRVVIRQTVEGTPSEWTESGRFIVERKTSLEVPTVHFPRVGQTVGRRPMFSGTGEPGAEIFICKENDRNTVLGTVRVDRNGSWAVRSQIELPVAAAPYAYSVNQSRDGATSGWITPNRTVIVAQVAAGFEKPVIEQPLDDATQALERMPLFSGTGMPGAELKVYRHSSTEVYATTRVDAFGRWSVRSQVELPVVDTAYQIAARQNMDGQDSAWSGVVIHFKVAEKIDLPVFTDPQQDAHVAPRAVIRGTALPGALVNLVEAHNAYVNWGSGITDDLGQWVIVTRDLPLRDFTLTGKAEKNAIYSGWMSPLAVKVIDGG